MKNVGVPFTPLRTPPRKSARTLGAYSLLSKALRKPDKIEPLRQGKQQRQTQALLVFKNFVVHLPEPIVRPGEFGALGGRLGVKMDLT
jgi:hypothetical protein